MAAAHSPLETGSSQNAGEPGTRKSWAPFPPASVAGVISGEVGSGPSVDAGLRPSAPQGEREARTRDPAHPSSCPRKVEAEAARFARKDGPCSPGALSPGRLTLERVERAPEAGAGTEPPRAGPSFLSSPNATGNIWGAGGNRGEAVPQRAPFQPPPHAAFPLGSLFQPLGGGGDTHIPFPFNSRPLRVQSSPRARGPFTPGGSFPPPAWRPDLQPPTRGGSSFSEKSPNTTERKVT